MLFTAASEGVFWNEFSSRFNFIAVDYLVYTREVVGNVRESYPIGVMLGAIVAVGLLAFALVHRPVWRAARAPAGTKRQRLASLSVAIALPVLSFGLIGDGPREAIGAGSARDLAGNGYYEFMRAFRSNDLDFRAFYRTLPLAKAEQAMRDEFKESGSRDVFRHGGHPLERSVAAQGKPRPMNVVLVSMESLGADYVESFGGRPGLTPNLDRLARTGLMFTETYATGLRTVRGLEALTLSIPPTPGHAVPMRANNKGFQTLGGVLMEKGYESLYLYGGYSYFDNMRDFFGGNGYTVIDRSAIPKEGISHETVWGVADEDLFRLAIREIDSRSAAGHKVFAHVMTTSNHRPFTYPEGRIDIASGTGRDGAVKYSDWAIGEFIREASSRPWFRDTLFVFVADHTSHGRGRTDLPPENYRIPLIMYAPGMIAPGRAGQVASQIDVAPTLLAMLNMSYESRFFGQDILTEGVKHPRALMANYLTVGYMERGVVVELSPKRRAALVDAGSGKPVAADDPRAEGLVDEAIAYYQVATEVLRGDAGAAARLKARAAYAERH
jgi:phosphoglycerol transferase MdoB-like AlkP superfamily enzyme